MSYLTKPETIRQAIDELTTYNILWMDTEIADWNTPYPRLSLIQILGSNLYDQKKTFHIFDILDKADLINYFVEKIMINSCIEKVFHNASFDVKYLGGKDQAKNVTCTLKIAKKITKQKLKTPNLKLKTLAQWLCGFQVELNEQVSDWGQRPLTNNQLEYAKLDVIYLAKVHQYLLEFNFSTQTGNKRMEIIEEIAGITPNTKIPSPTLQEIKSLSIKDIRLAYECPRLFYLVYRQGGEGNFIADKDLGETNTLFNQVSSQLIDNLQGEQEYAQLFDLEPYQINARELTVKLKTLLYKKCFFPYIQSQTQIDPQKAPLLLKTWEAITPLLQKWTDILISNRQSYSIQELFKQTFIHKKNSDQFFLLNNNQQQLIRGEFNNCLYQKDNHNLFIVNHQGEKSLNPEAQLVQIALSSYLIKETLGLEIDKTTYLLFPDEQEFNYSWSQIEQSVNQLISDKIIPLRSWLAWEKDTPSAPPKTTYQQLCKICPQQDKCQTFFPSSTDGLENIPVIIIPPGEPIKITDQIDENMSRDLVSTLNAFGLTVDYLETVAAPSFYRIKIKPKGGVKTVSIVNRSQDLQVQLGVVSPPVIQAQAGFVSVDIPRKDRQVAHFRQYISPNSFQGDEEFKIAIGVNLEGKLVEADLADPSSCHFLVGGTTGSGKSEFLRAVLLSLMVRHSPQFLKIAIVDPKRVTFPEFNNLPWLFNPVIKETEDGINLIDTLVEEMEKRYQILEINNCPDIKIYNQKLGYASDKVLPRIVCVFDEYADFMAEKATREPLESGIKRLGAKARAAGIHLIIGTQRPDAKVVTPLIRSNLPGRVALKTASEVDSTIVFGNKEKAATYLLGKGDLLYLRGGTTERLQSLYVGEVTFQ